MTTDFEQSTNFLALNSYHLPLSAPLRTMESTELFDGLTQGSLNMAVSTVTDGRLADPAWKVLQDDKKVFASEQVCLLVRQDRLMDEPRLRPALGELTGKLSAATLRNLNQQVEAAHGDATAVARAFLASVGLR